MDSQSLYQKYSTNHCRNVRTSVLPAEEFTNVLVGVCDLSENETLKDVAAWIAPYTEVLPSFDELKLNYISDSLDVK